MFQPTLRTVAFRGAALLLAAGTLGSARIASAARSTQATAAPTSTSTVHPQHAAKPALVALRKRIRHDERQVLLQTLKLTPKQWHQDRRAGQSIAVVAQNQQVPPATVSNALVGVAQSDLSKAVNAGTLKPKREQRLLARLQTHLPQRLNATPKPHPAKRAKGAVTRTTSSATTSTTAP
jgi:hypothetical protein